MEQIDWKRKLTSRKFWMAVCNFVSMLVVTFGTDVGTTEKITALIMAGGTMIAYIVAEGLVDAKGVKNEAPEISFLEMKPPEEETDTEEKN